jgi:alpha-glucuronidase
MNIESNTLDRLENTSDGCANGEQMENIQEQLEEWKKLTEKKNLNVFKEISNALKIQRMEWRREHDELSKGMTEI